MTMAEGRLEVSRCLSSSTMYSRLRSSSYFARTSLSFDSASSSSSNFLLSARSSASGLVLPMKMPFSISRIFDTNMPSGLRACSQSSQSLIMSPAKVSFRFSIMPWKRSMCRGSMLKWSNSSTMSGSGAAGSGPIRATFLAACACGGTIIAAAALLSTDMASAEPDLAAMASIGSARAAAGFVSAELGASICIPGGPCSPCTPCRPCMVGTPCRPCTP
mmetsp:Transcript_2487/g.7696  ORF Transcript_2487/g.7696 Transcript_2487/m.7696 type:complete len:218 (-) Transcript_2487:367-1020(-)